MKLHTTQNDSSLADPAVKVSEAVCIIIGADVFGALMENQRREISPGLFLR